jgi:hypothetical protein
MTGLRGVGGICGFCVELVGMFVGAGAGGGGSGQERVFVAVSGR